MALEQITFNIGAFNDADAGGNNYYQNTVFEIKKQSDNTFASIYSDPDGSIQIIQNGIDNVSSSKGECLFYIGDGEYYIQVGDESKEFSIKGGVISFEALRSLISFNYNSYGGESFFVENFYFNVQSGGGVFYYDPDLDKANHNGGTIIAPEAIDAWAGSKADIGTLLNWSGTGNGCFVRVIGTPTSKAELYIEWFGAVNDDGATDNSTVINHVKDLANESGGKVMLGSGGTGFSSTINLDTEHTTIIGLPNQPDQRGSALPSSYMVWTGGAQPMISSSSSYHVFEGFSVENRGSATSWLELNSGSIGNRYTRLDFVAGSGHTLFTEALIKSNGNRMGYSVFDNCQFKGASSIYIYIDGQGSSNAITPVTFKNRCIVESTNVKTTFFKIIDEKVETLNVRDCSFNQQQAELVIIDCEGTLNGSFDVVNFNDNEIDINPSVATSTDRLFKIYDTPNINMNGNTMSLGGQSTHICDLINSNITSFNANWYRSTGGVLFNPDSDSRVNEGVNHPDPSNTFGVCKVKAAGVTVLDYQSVMVLDGYTCHSKGGHVFEVEVTDGVGYQFRVSNVKPNYMRVGQIFTVVIKNTSGAAISAGSFTNGFESITTTAPADGEYMAYTFYFDGTTCREVGRLEVDAATGATGTFTTSDSKTVTVTNGLITSIV